LKPCPRCGVPNADDAVQCGLCQATMTPAEGTRLDLARLSVAEWAAGAATLIVVVALFLPWFSFGGIAGGCEYGALILALVTLSQLVSRVVVAPNRVPWPARHDIALLVLTGLTALVVLAGFVARPREAGRLSGLVAGAYVSLSAAVIAVAAAAGAALLNRRR